MLDRLYIHKNLEHHHDGSSPPHAGSKRHPARRKRTILEPVLIVLFGSVAIPVLLIAIGIPYAFIMMSLSAYEHNHAHNKENAILVGQISELLKQHKICEHAQKECEETGVSITQNIKGDFKVHTYNIKDANVLASIAAKVIEFQGTHQYIGIEMKSFSETKAESADRPFKPDTVLLKLKLERK
jgi:hypothetical protein